MIKRSKLFAPIIAVCLASSAPALAAATGGPTVDPVIQRFLEDLAKKDGPPIYTLTPEKAREVLTQVQTSASVNLLPADIKDRTLPVGPKGQTRIRVIRPQGVTETLPVVMYIHGGGWILGDKETHDRLVREIANGVRAVVVFVDYDRSPEAKFPTAIEQSYAATKYVAEHPTEFNVDPNRLAIAGDSVGGNMATVVTMMAKERNGPKIREQVLFYPVTDSNFETQSYNAFAEGPWLTQAAMKWYWNAYLPDVAARKNPHASPLQASLEQLRGLPPVLIFTNEFDVLRDEGEAYSHKLTQAGVKVMGVRVFSAIHDLVLLNPIADSPEVRGAILTANETLKKALYGTEPRKAARRSGTR